MTIISSNDILQYIVRGIHYILLFFMVITPFITKKPNLIFIHLTLSVFILFHWLINDQTCFLTQVECYLTGKKRNESFIHSIVSDVYTDPKTNKKLSNKDSIIKQEMIIAIICYIFLLIVIVYDSYLLGKLNYTPLSQMSNKKQLI
jgi:hypothetical protein